MCPFEIDLEHVSFQYVGDPFRHLTFPIRIDVRRFLVIYSYISFTFRRPAKYHKSIIVYLYLLIKMRLSLNISH